MKLLAKLLDYVLRSNKSNINHETAIVAYNIYLSNSYYSDLWGTSRSGLIVILIKMPAQLCCAYTFTNMKTYKV